MHLPDVGFLHGHVFVWWLPNGSTILPCREVPWCFISDVHLYAFFYYLCAHLSRFRVYVCRYVYARICIQAYACARSWYMHMRASWLFLFLKKYQSVLICWYFQVALGSYVAVQSRVESIKNKPLLDITEPYEFELKARYECIIFRLNTIIFVFYTFGVRIAEFYWSIEVMVTASMVENSIVLFEPF